MQLRTRFFVSALLTTASLVSSVSAAPSLVSAVSRKNHAGVDYDVPIPLNGQVGVESRMNLDVNDNLLLVLTFSEAVKAADGTLDDTEISVVEGRLTAVAIDGIRMTMNLAVPPDPSIPWWPTCVSFNLSGLVDEATGTQPLTGSTGFDLIVLNGDVNADSHVDAADAAIVQALIGQPVAAGNFRADVDIDGTISEERDLDWVQAVMQYPVLNRATCPPDADQDGLPNYQDNCPYNANPDQADADADGRGDLCDWCPGYDDRVDTDGDLMPDACDDCPTVYDPDQMDGDGDRIGDACDPEYNPVVVMPPEEAPPQIPAAPLETMQTMSMSAPPTCWYTQLGQHMPYDFDADGDIDSADFAFMQKCFTIGSTGPICDPDANPPDADCECRPADLNCDSTPDYGNTIRLKIDQDDLLLFIQAASGPGILVDYTALDANCDGIPNSCQGAPDRDTDSDGVPDYLDNCVTVANGPTIPGPQGDNQRDSDADTRGDACDNCKYVANPDQADSSNPPDGIGDACAADDQDGDGVLDQVDNCPFTQNGPLAGPNNQLDTDTDGWGDVCDNCVLTYNSDQADGDSDGVGNLCDNCAQSPNGPLAGPNNQLDTDSDGVGQVCDNSPEMYNPDQLDSDNDGVGDATDNCPATANGPLAGPNNQLDTDSDGLGDSCDNCVAVANHDQADTDSDTVGDSCDNAPLKPNTDQADADGDGVGDVIDNCVNTPNHDQKDTDHDLTGDACDTCTDSDGDGYGDPQFAATNTTCEHGATDPCPFQDGTDCSADADADLTYAHDELGRVTEIHRNGKPLVVYAYSGDQMSLRRTRTEYPERVHANNPSATANDVYVDYAVEHDGHRRVQWISNWGWTNHPGHFPEMGASEEQTFGYDAAGNRTSRQAYGNSKVRSVNYTYDGLNRVSTASDTAPTAATTTFNMDLLGNRTTLERTVGQTTTVRDYHEVTLANEYQQVTFDDRDQIPQNQPMYDARGNMVRDDGFDGLPNAEHPAQKDGFLYQYDIENRLTRVQYDDGNAVTKNVVEYSYDAIGRRVEAVKYDANGQNPATTRFYYDGQNVIAEYSYDDARSSGQKEQITRTYVNGTQYIDERIVMRNYTGTSEQMGDHYYFMEELYSVAGMVAANGRLEEAYVYDTYGQATIWKWPKGDVSGDGLVDSWDQELLDDSMFGYMNDGTPTPHADADFDMDGDVDNDDLAVVTASFTATPVELASSEVGNSYLFTGRPSDTLGSFTYAGMTEYRRLQDNRGRPYEPKHGRWPVEDMRGLVPDKHGVVRPVDQYRDGLNVHQYAKSNPAGFVDYSGLGCVDCRPDGSVPPYNEWVEGYPKDGKLKGTGGMGSKELLWYWMKGGGDPLWFGADHEYTQWLVNTQTFMTLWKDAQDEVRQTMYARAKALHCEPPRPQAGSAKDRKCWQNTKSAVFDEGFYDWLGLGNVHVSYYAVCDLSKECCYKGKDCDYVKASCSLKFIIWDNWHFDVGPLNPYYWFADAGGGSAGKSDFEGPACPSEWKGSTW